MTKKSLGNSQLSSTSSYVVLYFFTVPVSVSTLLTYGQMELELSRFQKDNNILELKVIEEHKKLKAKEEEMIMERTRVSITYRYRSFIIIVIVLSLKLRTVFIVVSNICPWIVLDIFDNEQVSLYTW